MGDGEFFAFFALGGALFADLDEFAFGAVDAFAGHAAVYFDLFLTFATGGSATAFSAAGAAALAVEVIPHPGEAGEGVLHAGELDLEAGLFGAGAHGEDIEDDFLAIDDADAGVCFPGALLAGGELVIEDDGVAAEVLGFGDEFLAFSGAGEIAFVGVADEGEGAAADADAEGFYECGEFIEEGGGFFSVVAGEVGADEKGALDHLGFFADVEHNRGRGKGKKGGLLGTMGGKYGVALRKVGRGASSG